MTPQSIVVTIVVPVFNEEGNVLPLTLALREVMPVRYCLLFVDDGSTDQTLKVIKKISTDYPEVRYCSFSRNFGHQAAIKAGLDYSVGECVVTMDGDMQHPPALIPRMLECWRAGHDVVNSRRVDESRCVWGKKLCSDLFYKVLRKIQPIPIESGTADFRLMDRQVVEVCKSLHECAFFWRGIVPWLGFRQVYIDYCSKERFSGQTKYSLRKMLRLAWDGISSFSLLPLRFSMFLGAIGIVGSFLYGLYILYEVFRGVAVAGWASIVLMTIIMGSLQLVMVGVVGEYLGKVFLSVQRRPAYIVKECSLGGQDE